MVQMHYKSLFWGRYRDSYKKIALISCLLISSSGTPRKKLSRKLKLFSKLQIFWLRRIKTNTNNIEIVQKNFYFWISPKQLRSNFVKNKLSNNHENILLYYQICVLWCPTIFLKFIRILPIEIGRRNTRN